MAIRSTSTKPLRTESTTHWQVMKKECIITFNLETSELTVETTGLTLEEAQARQANIAPYFSFQAQKLPTKFNLLDGPVRRTTPDVDFTIIEFGCQGKADVLLSFNQSRIYDSTNLKLLKTNADSLHIVFPLRKPVSVSFQPEAAK